tara:strand:- start:775 stop:1044 length:270 start_codon:yes stop_codon:yes gene_type:complete
MHIRKRVLVTGGAGFLGSHLCCNLLDKGYDVLCLDNFYTGSKENILTLLDISLAKQVLSWEPKIQLKKGLEKTIPYFEDFLSRDIIKKS